MTKRSAAFSLALFLIFDFFFGLTVLRKLEVPGAFKSYNLRVHHPFFHHGLTPNYNGFDEWGVPYRYCTDSRGFRSSCSDSLAKQRSFDFALMGDSMIEGLGVDYDLTIPGILGSRLNKSTLNFSVSSYSPSIHLAKYQYFLQSDHKFRNILIFLDISDLEDEYKHYTTLTSGQVVNSNGTSPEVSGSAAIKNYLKQVFPILASGISGIKTMWKSARAGKQVAPSGLEHDRKSARAGWTYLTKDDSDLAASVRSGLIKIEGAIKEISSIASREQSNVYVILYPWPHQIAFDPRPLEFERWAKQTLESKNTTVINLFPLFEKELKRYGTEAVIEKYYIRGDTHFNAAGHALIADYLTGYFSNKLED